MKSVLEPVISASTLKRIMDEPGIRLIDARQGTNARQNYFDNHLRGALWVDLEKDLSNPLDPQNGGRHPLPEPKEFAELLGRLGINTSTRVIVYDDTSGAIAGARFWWMLKAVGHEKVQLLDGGLKAAEELALPMNSGLEKTEPAPPYPVETWKLPVVNLTEVEYLSKNGKGTIIDVRSADRYRGEIEPIDPVAGHIPGAVNIPYQGSLDGQGKFLKKEELMRLFAGHTRKSENERVVVHCGSGVTACHTILAMDIAGLELPALYVGSWSEWCRV